MGSTRVSGSGIGSQGDGAKNLPREIEGCIFRGVLFELPRSRHGPPNTVT
jgi:hypothetical protein